MMRRFPSMFGVSLALAVLLSLYPAVHAAAQAVPPDDQAAATASVSDDVPREFEAFRHLIGSWKGFGIPEADRLRGWPETHAWAWKFQNGRPIGMALKTKGNPSLSAGQLGFDAAAKSYRLDGTDAHGEPVAFVGTLGDDDRTLMLDRVGEGPGGQERLTFRLNSNRIRYTVTLEVQSPGAPRFRKTVETGLTKEGESFAAKGAAASLPECIITGGAATLSASFDGKTYPLCCSGCLEEFKANPEKYVRKVALRAQSDSTPAAPPAPSFP